jgi:Zn-dependent peptidase ImmA (M78 family)/transcriptional regulator with XRE-family HTH domain
VLASTPVYPWGAHPAGERALGLTQTELASRINGLSQPLLSRMESGTARADEEVCVELALMAGLQAEWFTREGGRAIRALSPQFRARTRASQTLKTRILQHASLLNEEYERLQCSAKTLPLELNTMRGAPPAVAAAATRRSLGFSEGDPLPYLVLAVERLGIRVLGVPIASESLDAFCAWDDKLPVIAVTSHIAGDRIRWTIAHELGHLVLHHAEDDGRALETEADEFAAALLTPIDALDQSLPRDVSLAALVMAKTEWGVSVKTLIRRSRELGRVDKDRAISLYKQISARGWNRLEPGHVPVEKPRGLRKLAEIRYGLGPDTHAWGRDAAWSPSLVSDVLSSHAASDELPIESFRSLGERDSASNVVDLQGRLQRTRT